MNKGKKLTQFTKLEKEIKKVKKEKFDQKANLVRIDELEVICTPSGHIFIDPVIPYELYGKFGGNNNTDYELKKIDFKGIYKTIPLKFYVGKKQVKHYVDRSTNNIVKDFKDKVFNSLNSGDFLGALKEVAKYETIYKETPIKKLKECNVNIVKLDFKSK